MLRLMGKMGNASLDRVDGIAALDREDGIASLDGRSLSIPIGELF